MAVAAILAFNKTGKLIFIMAVQDYYNKSFCFQANRYEEWQAGQCVSSGPISTRIEVISDNNYLKFELKKIGTLRILTQFDFNAQNSNLLHDRIQYVRPSDFNPIDPVVCHLFCNDGKLNCVRFAMTNPDRIIEFYGHDHSSYDEFRKDMLDLMGYPWLS